VTENPASFNLDGQVAIVTGASSGLGRHFAITLARAGAKVALAARRIEALAETAREIEAFDGRALSLLLDVTDSESVRTCVAEAETELGPISILVNNAGMAINKPALEQDEDDWDRVLDTNLKGAWLMAQEVARHMVGLGHGGTIVNIASVLGTSAQSGVVSYCASKAGLIHLTRALAVELARHDIRVNALAPGYFETEINREFRASAAGDALLKGIPQRRYGKVEDLDGALLLLATDASRYMTGSVLVVDGGLTSRL
jgi:NAD(P)-dependent dehydrogenase (short-subunit alcohol dehydrogenase family)